MRYYRRVITLLTVLTLLTACSEEVTPLPSEVMYTASGTQHSDLWLKYLSLKDSIGSPADFDKYLKSKNISEEDFALSSLVSILKEENVADPEKLAEECLRENFNVTVSS